MKVKNELAVINTDVVRLRMVVLRGCQVLLDRDVAELYGVQTREENQAVKRNIEKFPEGYVLTMTLEEC